VPTSTICPIFTPDALPAATLPLYRGLGRAPNMLACIQQWLTVGDVLVAVIVSRVCAAAAI